MSCFKIEGRKKSPLYVATTTDYYRRLIDGTLDVIATDHAPHAAHEKEVPFEAAPMGTTGLETSFAALFTELVRPGVLSLPILIERLTAGGRLYGLEVPSIVPGAPAELCLVDLEAEWEAGAPGYASRSSNCCFHGRRLHGQVTLTVAGGAVAHRQRRPVEMVRG